MLIRSEFDIQFHLPQTLPIVAMLADRILRC